MWVLSGWGSFLPLQVCCAFVLWKISKMLFLYLLGLSYDVCFFILLIRGFNIDFWMLKQLHISEINLTLSWWIIIFFLYVPGFSLLVFCWQFLCLYSQEVLVCNFLFLRCLCLDLASGLYWSHRMSWKVFLLSSNLW